MDSEEVVVLFHRSVAQRFRRLAEDRKHPELRQQLLKDAAYYDSLHSSPTPTPKTS